MSTKWNISSEEALDILLPIVEKQKLILFAGSGVSVPSGLPTWDEFLEEFVVFCEERILPVIEDNDDRAKFERLIADAKANYGKHPDRVLSALRQSLIIVDKKTTLTLASVYSDWLQDIFRTAKENAYYKPLSPQGDLVQPNEYHNTIVNTNYPFIITTNYDKLFEEAARQNGFLKLASRSYTFHRADSFAGAIYQGTPSIIHVHGELKEMRLNDIVLTAEDYAHIKRDYPGFRMALSSIFINYSVLFVGYGGSDPHLEDFLEEISYNLEWSQHPSLPNYYLIVLEDKADAVLSNYKNKQRIHIVTVPEYPETLKLLARLQKQAPRPKEKS